MTCPRLSSPGIIFPGQPTTRKEWDAQKHQDESLWSLCLHRGRIDLLDGLMTKTLSSRRVKTLAHYREQNNTMRVFYIWSRWYPRVSLDHLLRKNGNIFFFCFAVNFTPGPFERIHYSLQASVVSSNNFKSITHLVYMYHPENTEIWLSCWKKADNYLQKKIHTV